MKKFGLRRSMIALVALTLCIGVAFLDLLIFERFHETLGLGVVVGVRGAAHAAGDRVLFEQVRIASTGILHAAIGVMHQPRRRLALPQRQA